MAEENAEQAAAQAATRVQEAAANIHQSVPPRERITDRSRETLASDRSGGTLASGEHPRFGQPSAGAAESVARRYFEAINAHDLDAAVALWAVGGRENVRGQVDVTAPEGVRAFIADLLGALPDLRWEIVSTTSEGDRCAVQWRMVGTFAGPGTFGGLAPTGHPLVLEGIDLLTVRDGLIQSNDAFTDTMEVPRQIGMMPPLGSTAEQRLLGAFNVKTRVTGRAGRSVIGGEPELVAEGVWVVQGQPGRCNVYLIEEEGGLTMFDAGAHTMVRAVAAAGARLGGIRRVVLGHGHTDHRGTAPALGVPVFCHPEEVQDAEGSGGFRYWPEGLTGLPTPHRQIHRVLHRFAWDGGPVKIAGTLTEGEEVAGFRVIELPGHAPGLIGLWRESDRLALVSDTFYTLDMWARDCPPKVPFSIYNYDTEQARASIRKLAALEPAAAWPGHAKPVTGDVRGQLERAADAP
jgi:hydroxyacylglutathione hydrolase